MKNLKINDHPQALLKKLDLMLLNLGVSQEFIQHTPEDSTEISEMASILSANRVHQKINQKKAKKIQKILQAKRKIYEGSFGSCDECGAEISQERLNARPFAVRCIHCQEEKERSDKHVSKVMVKKTKLAFA